MKTKTLQRTWQEYSNEEKLIAIQAYLDGMKSLENAEHTHLQWLREHLPAHNLSAGKNYIFISYSHRDFAKVYRDLATFLYNADKKVRFWYDEGLPAGKNWAEEVKKYIEHPNCVGAIFYLSENLLSSSAVLQEVEMIASSGKPYVSVALDKDKFSASRIFKGRENDPLFEKFNRFFPDADTALIYDEEYENVLYRINKIEETFNVTEDVLSDFVCEETEGGLKLVAYEGKNTDVFIPEKINDKPIVAVEAQFPTAISLFIPKTVRAIYLPPVPEDTYPDLEQENTASVFRLLESLSGGYQRTGAPFGEAENLAIIRVDNANPYFYDQDGVLYSADGTLVRVPPCAEITVEALSGVQKIGKGAFYGCLVKDEEFSFPESLTEIEDGAFAHSRVGVMMMEGDLQEIGENAFSEVEFRFPILDFQGSFTSIKSFAFRSTSKIDAVFLPPTVERIENGAFFSSAVQLVSTGGGLTEIGEGAFALCSLLDCIDLKEGLESIGSYAFYGCSSLWQIEIPASVRFIGEGAFDDCEALRYVYYKGTRKQFWEIQTSGNGLPDEFLELVVCKDEKFRRFKCAFKRWIRKIAQGLLKKV